MQKSIAVIRRRQQSKAWPGLAIATYPPSSCRAIEKSAHGWRQPVTIRHARPFAQPVRPARSPSLTGLIGLTGLTGLTGTLLAGIQSVNPSCPSAVIGHPVDSRYTYAGM